MITNNSNRFKHNKKRNTGLIYELLIHKLATSFVNSDNVNIDKALNIIRKYFSSK